MQLIKEYFRTTIVSFAFVILIQAFIYLFCNQNLMHITNIFITFGICLIVNIGIFIINSVEFKSSLIRDISSIITIVVIVLIMSFIVVGKLYWQDVVVSIVSLTFVYYGVVFLLYSKERQDAKMINDMINKKKGNM